MIQSFKKNYHEGLKAATFLTKTMISLTEQQEALSVATHYYAKAIQHFCLKMNIIDRHSVIAEVQQAVAFLTAIAAMPDFQQQDPTLRTLLDNALHQWALFQKVMGYDAFTEATLFAQKMARLVEGALFADAHLHPVTPTDTPQVITEEAPIPPAIDNTSVATATSDIIETVTNSAITSEAFIASPTTTSIAAVIPPSFDTDQSPVIAEMAHERKHKDRVMKHSDAQSETQLPDTPPKRRPTVFFDPASVPTKSVPTKQVTPKKSWLSRLVPPAEKNIEPIQSQNAIINPKADAIICRDLALMTGWNENNL